MHHLTLGISRVRSIGYAPEVDLATDIGLYLEWLRAQGSVRGYFTAGFILREKRIVQQVAKSPGSGRSR